MPRIPYTPDPPPADTSPSDLALIHRIRDRRIAAGHDGLVELDRQLLHAPPIASGWNEFLGAVRTQNSLPDDVREMIICRVAGLNKADYEWGHHAPLLRSALVNLPGVKGTLLVRAGMVNSFLEQLKLRRESEWIGNISSSRGFEWSVKYRELLCYVDAMTTTVKVPDQVFKALRDTLADGEEGDRQMVEITATCAAYNCVSRFLVALNVGDANR